MTKERASEIIAAARAAAVYGPWCDQLDKVMTKDERREVNAVWDTLPGWYSFTWTLEKIARGDV